VLADDPAFFVARGNTSADIIILALALVLIPPTALVAIEALFIRLPRVMNAVHLAFIALLAAVFALQVIADAAPGGSSVLLIPLALALGAAAAFAYRATPVLPSMLTVLSPAPVLFLVFFLFFSDVSKLVLPEEEATVEASVGGDTPVVFVVLDEFSGLHLLDRSGRINGARFPNFARLARTSDWYRNATTVSDRTDRAVPAILTGTRPNANKLPIVSDYPENLFTLLGGDYELDVHETASHLCPNSLCEREREPIGTRLRSLGRDLRTVALRRLLPDDLASGLPAVNRTFGNFEGSAQVHGGVVKGADQAAPQARGQSFDSFARGVGSGRSLHFLHILLPHIPWLYLPTGQQYVENGPIPGLDEENDRWDKENVSLPLQSFQRYMLQAKYVDRLLGRLMADLRQRDIFDRSLIVVMADHGVSFRAGDYRRRVSRDNFADLASIPLFIKRPRQQTGRVDDSPATSVDVVPTIADFVGADLPWDSDGQSLKDGPAPARAVLRVATSEGSEVRRSFTAFQRQRDQFVAQAVDLFGPGDRSLFAPPNDGALVGRPTSLFSIVPHPGARVRLDSGRSFRSVDPSGPLVPVFVTGQVSAMDIAQRLAIAVNGRVAATTSTFREAGQTSFTAVVSPNSLRRGSNSVQVLAVRGSGAQVALESLGQAASLGLDLVWQDGRELLKGQSGTSVTVVPEAVGGYVDALERPPNGLTVRGWSAVEGRIPDRVVVYLNRRLIAEGRPKEVREDVADDLGPAARTSGFRVSGNLPTQERPSAADIRAFGIFGDRALELVKRPTAR
jgi:hypothetical protein